MDMYFILWIRIQYYFILFLHSNFPRFGHWNLFQLASTFPPALFLENFLTFQQCKILQVHLVYFLSHPRIHFSEDPGSLSWRMVLETKIWGPSVLMASSPSQLTEQGNLCV